MKILLVLLLTLSTAFSYSQTTGNYQIEITSTASASHSEFKIHLLKNGDKTKVIYLKRKQEDLKPTKQDSLEIQELLKTFENDLEARKRLTQILKKYKRYEKDSLIISSNHPLLRISDSLLQERTLKVDESDRRIILDGTRATIKVRHENGSAYELYASSPRNDTHPLLYQFMTSALDLYRSKVEKPILNKSDTQGY
ncbi:hypothetical protein K3G39_07290 [Pontibacter sp. HSC-14F20]|uniref:hypothetical protein n=1 Tax=Pontibacter sp. HSC-14F20 TaxID=2864136 RepID=UPI001C72E80E|nr:hypothetical protein [Pontibacter sp. HSC-14F20]MBX0333037.1 hypothetical protein [Pontibacter sp. HSC-14F20]